jgi:hypothetical protein
VFTHDTFHISITFLVRFITATVRIPDNAPTKDPSTLAKEGGDGDNDDLDIPEISSPVLTQESVTRTPTPRLVVEKLKPSGPLGRRSRTVVIAPDEVPSFSDHLGNSTPPTKRKKAENEQQMSANSQSSQRSTRSSSQHSTGREENGNSGFERSPPISHRSHRSVQSSNDEHGSQRSSATQRSTTSSKHPPEESDDDEQSVHAKEEAPDDVPAAVTGRRDEALFEDETISNIERELNIKVDD